MMELERKEKKIVENHVQEKSGLEGVSPELERVYEEAQTPE